VNKQACVYLVGAGPGDPELLTVKAQRLLQQADVVVYDRLVSSAILDLIPPGTSRIYVGKASGQHSMPQAEINDLLLNLARNGHQVVRLKGGDPFVFGRGSEEAQHLARHGTRFEVVPGITSAAACSAYAGIPLSHRGLARSVRFVTGHCRADQPLDLDWDGLADPQTTLVFYMGLANLPQIQDGLLDAGMAATTPVAFVENGTTPQQRRILTTLNELQEAAQRHEVQAPALIIIGAVVGFAEELDWFVPSLPEDVDHDAQRVG
jgi:uroporphyrin-III C-methyltransferase/precorrin-2 dehydrogenase/sirohydrochlorin ferrochelatase/uroporphyrin-III C-methyltransferase